MDNVSNGVAIRGVDVCISPKRKAWIEKSSFNFFLKGLS
jgi:hypothetical protein